MKPEDLVKELERLQNVSGQVSQAAVSGARSAVSGVRVRGHRVAMSGPRIRVTGPMAPQVAEYLAKQAGQGAEKEIRRLLP